MRAFADVQRKSHLGFAYTSVNYQITENSVNHTQYFDHCTADVSYSGDCVRACGSTCLAPFSFSDPAVAAARRRDGSEVVLLVWLGQLLGERGRRRVCGRRVIIRRRRVASLRLGLTAQLVSAGPLMQLARRPKCSVLVLA